MIIVTGAVGFIGMHLAKRLLEEGYEVAGIDNFTDDGSIALKEARAKLLEAERGFTLKRSDILDLKEKDVEGAEAIFHEAALAGVRTSVEQPLLYDKVNVHGTVHLLDLAARSGVQKFLFASSSSVYGDVTQLPTPETHPLRPVSPYGASKAAAEKYCFAFHRCFGLPVFALRYFTVYGPWGRPDMLILKAIRSCYEGAKLLTFRKNGEAVDFTRDFSYVDDVVAANMLALKSKAHFGIYNVSAKREVKVSEVIATVQELTGKEAVFDEAEPNPADPLRTLGDVRAISNALGYEPKTQIEEGLAKTVEWYKSYAGIE